MRKTILRYAIALDLVVIATGAAFLLAENHAGLIAIFLGAVFVAAWVAGRGGGAIATTASLVVFGFGFSAIVRPEHYILFTAAGVFLSLGAPWLRASAAPLRPAETTPPVAAAPVARAAPAWLVLIVPVILIMVYTDLSETLITTLGIPSLLQPMIVTLGIVAWLYRDTLRPLRVILHPVTLALVAYCVVLFVSSIWAHDPWLADEQIVDAVKNLLVYLIIAIFAASWKSLQNGLRTLVLAAAFLAAISLVQILMGFNNELGGLATLSYGNIYEEGKGREGGGSDRRRELYAQILILIIPLALYLGYVAQRTWRRFAWLILAVIIGGGVLVTYSRGAMVALAVMATLVMVALRVPLMRVAAGSVIVVLLLLLAPGNVGRRFTTMVSLLPQETYYVAPEASLERRRLIANSALRMFDDHFLLGVGVGNFGVNFAPYARQVGSSADLYYEHGEIHREHAHSLYLEIAAENGILGVLVLTGLLVLAYRELRRSRRLLAARGITREAQIALGLSVALSGFLVTSVFLHSTTQRYLFLLLALITALSCIVTDRQETDPPRGVLRA